MTTTKKIVMDFLSKYGMCHADVDLEKNCELFIGDMEDALRSSGGGTLLMLPTYTEVKGGIPTNDPVIVIDAGGTNLRVSLINFDNSKKAVIEYFELYEMPGTYGEITASEFYDALYEYLLPILDKGGKIGFCFSHGMEMAPNKDGRLTRLSKETRITGLDGEMIGEKLLDKISEKGHGKKSVVLLNDTTTTLLGGKAAYPERVFDNYIGLVLGTGFNTSYIEKNRNILKLNELHDMSGNMIINVETACFKKAPLGVIDRDFDNEAPVKGRWQFEKAISGGYQGGLILAVLKQAAKDGLFSEKVSKKILGMKSLDTKDIDDFLYYPYDARKSVLAALLEPDNGIRLENINDVIITGDLETGIGASYSNVDLNSTESDRYIIFYIIDSIIERAAMFVTFVLAALLEKTSSGKNPCAPVCVTADGTTFYKSKILRPKLDHYVKTYINEQKHRYLEFIEADNCVLVGTAIAALQNCV